jgi:ABC-type sugar transport system ATPase subunit
MALLSVNNLSKQERGNYVIHDVSFVQEPLQKIAITGETGSGKTTLLKMIAGLVQPDEGTVLFENVRVKGPLEKLIPGHAGIAILSQHFELRNNYLVEEELESKNLLTEEEANRIYAVCRINHLLKRKTDQLSGGERQRIVLARLLTTRPRLLLLDEPFSNLDAGHKSIIKSVLADISSELHTSCILVSHDAPDVLSWADHILVMQAGQIIQQGRPLTIYRQPVNEYCAGLFGEYNLLAGDCKMMFSGSSTLLIENKQLMIRPEFFHINGGAYEETITGKVQALHFWGSYYLLDVLAGNQILRIQVNNDQFLPGEEINLSVSPADMWWI